ncbi:MAG TPA: protein-disulfide reductase DsbD domain-containing protein [Puia sp.]|nr:protein-disulfide reductase DsbD domain-containing protein [Puia sp.]
MKQIILLGVALLITGTILKAQSIKEVTWAYTSKKIAAQTYEVHMTATVGGDFHIYSQKGGDGPVSTTFTLTKNPLITPSGPIKEVGKMVRKYEEAFKSEVRYYAQTVDFVQVIKVKSAAKTNLAGKVEFMVCNDRECLPPSEVEFKINLGG